jgi:hypothetical protein
MIKALTDETRERGGREERKEEDVRKGEEGRGRERKGEEGRGRERKSVWEGEKRVCRRKRERDVQRERREKERERGRTDKGRGLKGNDKISHFLNIF